MRLGSLTITWGKKAQLDDLRTEQAQGFAEMTALSERQFKLLAEALTGAIGGRIGLGFQKPGDDSAGSTVRY